MTKLIFKARARCRGKNLAMPCSFCVEDNFRYIDISYRKMNDN